MSAPRFTKWFWPLIESFVDDEAKMIAAFQEMPRERLIVFFRLFVLAKSEVNPQNWGDVNKMYASEDGNDDFAMWVVSRGQEYYQRVRKNHQELKAFFDDLDAWQALPASPEYVAGRIFAQRFDEEISDFAFPR